MYRILIKSISNSNRVTVGLVLGFPLVLSIAQILLITLKFKLESPKYYVIKMMPVHTKMAAQLIYPVEMAKNDNSDGNSDSISIKASCYDANKDGRTFRSLKKPKYWRAFL